MFKEFQSPHKKSSKIFVGLVNKKPIFFERNTTQRKVEDRFPLFLNDLAAYGYSPSRPSIYMYQYMTSPPVQPNVGDPIEWMHITEYCWEDRLTFRGLYGTGSSWNSDKLGYLSMSLAGTSNLINNIGVKEKGFYEGPLCFHVHGHSWWIYPTYYL